MIKLHCKLKQQTPMLHFQPDETGVCLRGTEVKPKMDRFIIRHFQDRDKVVPNNWFLQTDKGERERTGNMALNYKIRFETSGIPKIEEKKINKSFFGNQNSSSGKKRTTKTVTKPRYWMPHCGAFINSARYICHLF